MFCINAPHPPTKTKVQTEERTYRAERYKYRRGDTVVIDAQWIGPKEHKDDKRHYRVLVEK